MAIEHRIVQTINLTPGAVADESSELQQQLRILRRAINRELADRGLAIMDLAFSPQKNDYHYTVPTSYDVADYPFIKAVVEKHCAKS